MKKLLSITIICLIGAVLYAQPETVNVGTGPNTGDGDPLRTAFIKVNTNDDAAFDSLAAHLARFLQKEWKLITGQDTARIPNAVFTDTTFYENFEHESGYRFLVIRPNGAADTGVLYPQRKGLEYIIPIEERLNDRQNGEMAFYYYNPALDSIIKTYFLGADLTTMAALIFDAEMDKQYIYDLELRLSELERKLENKRKRK